MNSSPTVETGDQFDLSSFSFNSSDAALESGELHRHRSLSKLIKESIESYNSLVQGIVKEQLSKR